VGKTALGVALARALAPGLRIEIVSMDSALVYRGMDIGSGKPDLAERAGIPHHLLDLREPCEPYSAADFARDARAVVTAILERGARPLLLGGTGLYLRAFRDGLSPLPAADPRLRRSMECEAACTGWPALHRRLACVDPQAAARIRPTDPQRIQRALEVHALTGVPISQLQRRSRGDPSPWPLHVAALIPADRGWLHQRIQQRFEEMLRQGLEREVRELLFERSLSRDLPALRAVGYRQLLAHLHGELSREEAISQAIAATRQLARRQLTWLRRETLELILDPAKDDVTQRLCCWARTRLGTA
jgi:tRNA dimethylallyltransferase